MTNAQSTLSCTILVVTNTPGAISKQFGNKLNSETWQSGGPRTWLCTEASFRSVDLTTSPQLWEMTFSWQEDVDGWDKNSAAVFMDPLNGKAAPDLIDDVGIKVIEWHEEIDFNNYFN